MTYMTGRAVVKAAAEVVRKVKSHAADILECDVSDLELRPDGRVGIIGVPQQEITFRDVSLRAHWAVGGPIIGSDSFAYDKPTIYLKRTVVSGLTFPRIGVFLFILLFATSKWTRRPARLRCLRLGQPATLESDQSNVGRGTF